jgi:hypothetical protein
MLFQNAEYAFYTHESNFDTYDTLECILNTHKIDFYTQSKIPTRKVWF